MRSQVGLSQVPPGSLRNKKGRRVLVHSAIGCLVEPYSLCVATRYLCEQVSCGQAALQLEFPLKSRMESCDFGWVALGCSSFHLKTRVLVEEVRSTHGSTRQTMGKPPGGKSQRAPMFIFSILSAKACTGKQRGTLLGVGCQEATSSNRGQETRMRGYADNLYTVGTLLLRHPPVDRTDL